MADLGNYSSSFEINLKGASKLKADIDALLAHIQKINDIEISIGAVTPEAPRAAITKFVSNINRELERAEEKIKKIKIGVVEPRIAKDIGKEFYGALSQEEIDKAARNALAPQQKGVDALKASVGEVRELLKLLESAALVSERFNEKMKSPESAEALRKVQGFMEGISTQTRSVTSEIKRFNDAITKGSADTASVIRAGLEKAYAEKQDALKKSVPSGKSMDTLFTAVSSEAMFEPLATGANVVAGRISQALRGAISGAKDAVSDLSTAFTERVIPRDVFSKMFSPQVIANVERLRTASADVALAARKIEQKGLGEPDAAGQYTHVLELQKAIKRNMEDRRDVANNMLAIEREITAAYTATGAKAQTNISAQERITDAVTRQKEEIINVIATIGSGASVLNAEAVLRAKITDIIKAGGNAEIEEIRNRSEIVNLVRTQLDYAKRLKEESAKMTGSTSLERETRLGLLQESYKAYKGSASFAQGPQLTEAFKGASETRTAIEQATAWDTFRNSITEVITALNSGIPAGYKSATQALIAYSAASSAGMAVEAGDLEAVQKLLAVVRRRYTELKNAKSSADLNERQNLGNMMGAAATIMQNSADAKVRAGGDSVQRYVAEESRITAEKVAQAKVNERIRNDLATINTLYMAGVDILSNRARLESIYAEAIKNNIPVEQQIVASIQNKNKFIRTSISQYEALKAVVNETALADKSRTDALKEQKVLLEATKAAFSQSGVDRVRVDGDRKSSKWVQEELLSVEAQLAAAKEKERLQKQEEERLRAVKTLVDERSRQEKDLVAELSRLAAISDAGLISQKEYLRAVQLRVEAERRGIDVSSAGLDIRAAERQALAGQVAEERRLYSVMSDANRAMAERKKAADEWRATIGKVAQMVEGGKEFYAAPAPGAKKSRIDANYVEQRQAEGVAVATELGMSVQGLEKPLSATQAAFERIKTSITGSIANLREGYGVLNAIKTSQRDLIALAELGKTVEVGRYAAQLREAASYEHLVLLSKNFGNSEEKIRAAMGGTNLALELRIANLRKQAEYAKAAALAAPTKQGRAEQLDVAATAGFKADRLQTSLDMITELNNATVALGSNGAVSLGKLSAAFDNMARAAGPGAGVFGMLRSEEFQKFYESAAGYIRKSEVIAREVGGNVAVTAKKQAADVASSIAMMYHKSAMSVTGTGSIDKSQRETLDKLSREWSVKSALLTAEAGRIDAAERLNNAIHTAVTELNMQQDVIKNNKILMDAYVQSVLAGVPVNVDAYAVLRNQSNTLSALHTQMQNINAELASGNISEQQRLALYGQQKGILSEMLKHKEALSKGVDVSGKTLTMADVAAQRRSVNAAMAGLNAPGTSTKTLAEKQLFDILSGTSGVQRDSAEYTKAQVTDTQVLLGQARDLRTIFTDTTRSTQERLNAMHALVSVLEQIRGIMPETGMPVAGVERNLKSINAAIASVKRLGEEFKAAITAGSEVKIPREFMTIQKALESSLTASKDPQRISESKAELESKYATEIERSRTAMLSGVDVLQNFVRLRTAVNEAASQGVVIDNDSLRVLNQKAAVMALIEEQIRRAVSFGGKTNDPYSAASQVTFARSGIDMLSSLGMDKNKIAEMQQLLDPLVNKAGAALKDSLAAAKLEATKLQEAVTKLFAGMRFVEGSTQSVGTAFNANTVYVQRIIENVRSWQEAENKILRNHEFLGKMTADEIAQQQQKVASLERFGAILAKVGKEQEKVTSALARMGDFNISDVLTSQGVGKVSAAAMRGGMSKDYLKLTDALRGLSGYTKEIDAAIAKNPALAASLGPVAQGLRLVGQAAGTASDEVSKYASAHQRAASKESGSSFFDKFRVIWFMQLRAFWAMFSNMQQAIAAAVDYAHTLNVMRAVTQGTTQDITKMNAAFQDISREVPLALAGISKAALEVAKAGFSVEDTMLIINSASKLAYATQSDIAKVADLQSVIIHAWGKSASEAEDISDKLFNAVAKSRADINGLADAIGYVSGIAPQANVTLESALSMMAILTNAGLTMSKAGTYMRQFINDLMNPSEKFVQILGGMGIKASEVDPRLNNMADIFRKLSAAGMNAADAFAGMSIRAASAFSVMLNNAGMIDDFNDMISESGTTLAAYEKSTQDVASTWQLLANSAQVLVVSIGDLSGPTAQKVLMFFKDILDSMTAVVKAMSGLGDTFGSTVSSIIGFGAVALTALLFLGKFTGAAIAAGRAAGGAATGVGLIGKSIAAIANFGAKMGGMTGLGGRILALIFGGLAGTSVGAIMATAAAIGILSTAFTSLMKYMRRDTDAYIATQKNLANQIDKLRGITSEEIKLRVDVGESRAIGGKVSAYIRDIKKANLNTDIQRDMAGDSIRNISGALRQSTVNEIRVIGEEIGTINISAADSASAAAEKMQKVMELYEKAATLLNKVPEGLEKNLIDQRKNLGVINDMIDQLTQAREKLESKREEKPGLMDTFNKNLMGALTFSDVRTNKQRALSSLARFEDTRTKGVGEALLGFIPGSAQQRPNEYRNIGKTLTEAISDVIQNMDSEITPDTATWEKATADLDSILKQLSMSLSEEERQILDNSMSMEGYIANLKKIIDLKRQQVREMDIGQLDPTEINTYVSGIAKAAQAYSSLMSSGTGDLAAIDTLEKMRAEITKAMEAAKKMGVVGETVNTGLYETVNKLFGQHAKAVEKIRKTSEESIRSMTQDPNKVLYEDLTKVQKERAEAFKSQLTRFNNAARSITETAKFANIVDVPEMRKNLQAASDAVIEEMAHTLAQYSELAKSGKVDFLQDPELLKSFNKSVRETFTGLIEMSGETGGDVIDNIEKALTRIKDSVREYTAPRDAATGEITGEGMEIDTKDIVRSTKTGELILDSFRNRARDSIFDSYQSMLDSVVYMFSAAERAAKLGLSSGDMEGIFEAAFKRFDRMVKMANELRRSITDNQKSISSFSNSLLVYGAAVESMSDLTTASARTAEFTENMVKSETQLKDLKTAVDVARNSVQQWREVMTATANQGVGSSLNVKEMQAASEALKTGINSSASAIDNLASTIKKLRDEMRSLKLEAIKSQFDFRSKMLEAEWANTLEGQNKFLTAQISLNEKRAALQSSAPYMDVASLRGSLTEIRDQLIDLWKAFPESPTGTNAYDEAKQVQREIIELYALEAETKQAEANVAQAFQEELVNNTAGMLHELKQITAILSNVQQAQMPAMAPLPVDPAMMARQEKILANAQASGKKVPGDLFGIARMEESGTKGSATIGDNPRDLGGVSYGTYQFASKAGTMDSFVESLKTADKELYDELQKKLRYYKQLFGADKEGPTDWTIRGESYGKRAWQDLAASYPEKVSAAEQEFTKRTHYDPALANIKKKTGVDLEAPGVNPAIRSMLMSTAIHAGPGGMGTDKGATAIFADALKKTGGKTDESLIREVMQQRANRAVGNPSEDALLKRFVRESGNLLELYKNNDAGSVNAEMVSSLERMISALDKIASGAEAAEATENLSAVEINKIKSLSEKGDANPAEVLKKELAALRDQMAKQTSEKKLEPAIEKDPGTRKSDNTKLYGVPEEMRVPPRQEKEEQPANQKPFITAANTTRPSTSLAQSPEAAVPDNKAVVMDVPVTGVPVPEEVTVPVKVDSSDAESALRATGEMAEKAIDATKGMAEANKEYTNSTNAATDATSRYTAAKKDYEEKQRQLNARTSALATKVGSRTAVESGETPKNFQQVWSDLAIAHNADSQKKMAHDTMMSMVSSVKTGFASAATSALHDIASGEATAGEAIEQMSWQIIDQWMTGMTDSIFSSFLSWMATDSTKSPDIGPFSGFATWWKGGEGPESGVGAVADQVGQLGGAAAFETQLTAAGAALLPASEQLSLGASTFSATTPQFETVVTQLGTTTTQLDLAGTGLQEAAVYLRTAAEAMSFSGASAAGGTSLSSFSKSAAKLSDKAASFAKPPASGSWMDSIGNFFGSIGSFFGFHEGGLIFRHEGGPVDFAEDKFSGGGVVTKGNRQADSTLAALTKGEFVVREPAVRKYGLNFMRELNEGKTQNIAKMISAADVSGVQYEPASFTPAGQVSTNTTGANTGNQSGQVGAAAGTEKGRVNLTSINISDPQDTERYLASQRGQKLIMNIMARGSMRQIRRGNI